MQVAVGLWVCFADALQQFLDELAALLFKRLLDLPQAVLCVTVDLVLARRLGALILRSVHCHLPSS